MPRLSIAALVYLLGASSPLLAQPSPSIRSMGVAISFKGEVFQIFNRTDGEDATKAAVQAACESKSGGSCESLSVPMTWSIIGLLCKKDGQEELFLGGSGTGFARRRAINKANSAGFESAECKDAYAY